MNLSECEIVSRSPHEFIKEYYSGDETHAKIRGYEFQCLALDVDGNIQKRQGTDISNYGSRYNFGNDSGLSKDDFDFEGEIVEIEVYFPRKEVFSKVNLKKPAMEVTIDMGMRYIFLFLSSENEYEKYVYCLPEECKPAVRTPINN